jgi:TRAP-type C4-dicarboxylate transport system substrate-binding protein
LIRRFIMYRKMLHAIGGIVIILSFFVISPPWLATVHAQTIKLTFHDPMPPSTMSDGAVWWMDQVETRTGGKVKFERIFGGSLGKFGDQMKNLKGRIFDVGLTSIVYTPASYPLTTVFIQPFIVPSLTKGIYASYDLFQSTPALMEEGTAINTKIVGQWWLEALELMSHVPINKMDDMKGLRIRGHGGSADAMAAAGFTVVGIPWSELPQASERKVVDAASLPIPTLAAETGFQDIFKYWITNIPFYHFHSYLSINLDAWNSLPRDVQDVMLQAGADLRKFNVEHVKKKIDENAKVLAKAGVKQIVFPQDELEKFIKIGGPPNWEKWIMAREAEKLPGREVLNNFRKLLEKY